MPDYKNENVSIDFLSALLPEEANAMIGKTIATIEAHEYSLIIKFTDGSELKCSGNSYGDCAMGVEYYK